MIEYLTKTGLFAVLWVIVFLLSLCLGYTFIKRNGTKFIHIAISIIIFDLITNGIARELIGKSNFDLALTLIKDAWFLLTPILFITLFILYDKNIVNETFRISIEEKE